MSRLSEEDKTYSSTIQHIDLSHISPEKLSQLQRLWAMVPGNEGEENVLAKWEGERDLLVYALIEADGSIVATISGVVRKNFPSAPEGKREFVINIINAATDRNKRKEGHMNELMSHLLKNSGADAGLPSPLFLIQTIAYRDKSGVAMRKALQGAIITLGYNSAPSVGTMLDGETTATLYRDENHLVFEQEYRRRLSVHQGSEFGIQAPAMLLDKAKTPLDIGWEKISDVFTRLARPLVESQRQDDSPFYFFHQEDEFMQLTSPHAILRTNLEKSFVRPFLRDLPRGTVGKTTRQPTQIRHVI